jgi:hypothetical protein
VAGCLVARQMRGGGGGGSDPVLPPRKDMWSQADGERAARTRTHTHTQTRTHTHTHTETCGDVIAWAKEHGATLPKLAVTSFVFHLPRQRIPASGLWREKLSPKTKTLHPNPYHPKPYTLHPKPYSLHPKHYTLKPEILNPKP